MNNIGTLYLVPTPIGNIKDITLRALEVIKNVDLVYAEDTRETKKLLDYYGITKKIFTNNDINESENITKIVRKLKEGTNIALLSDRGTPLISDPGFKIIKACIENNIGIVSLPGATALITALTLSGFSTKPFFFFGFLNNKSSKRKDELKRLVNIEATLIFYEAVHRIEKTLNDMLEIFGNRNIAIARELTKQYEQIIRGTIKEVLSKKIVLKGEFVIIVEGKKESENITDKDINKEICLKIKEGYSEKEAIKLVSKENKLSKSVVYNNYQYLKKGD